VMGVVDFDEDALARSNELTSSAIGLGPEEVSQRSFIAGLGIVGAIWIHNPGILFSRALPAMIALGLLRKTAPRWFWNSSHGPRIGDR
jgi:hypothetical protein